MRHHGWFTHCSFWPPVSKYTIFQHPRGKDDIFFQAHIVILPRVHWTKLYVQLAENGQFWTSILLVPKSSFARCGTHAVLRGGFFLNVKPVPKRLAVVLCENLCCHNKIFILLQFPITPQMDISIRGGFWTIKVDFFREGRLAKGAALFKSCHVKNVQERTDGCINIVTGMIIRKTPGSQKWTNRINFARR